MNATKFHLGKPIGTPPPGANEDWNQRLQMERAKKLERENRIAEGLYIETDLAIEALSEVVETIWTAANNLANSLPMKMAGLTDDQKLSLRNLVISELNFAKGEKTKYLQTLEEKIKNVEKGQGQEVVEDA